MSGWISIQRNIREHWIWQDPVKFKWWLDILLTANHRHCKVNIGMQLIDCDRGQSIMSLQSWALRWGVAKDTTRNFFVLLEKDGMIKTENLIKTTRLTVCNYDLYQTDLHDEQTQAERWANAGQTQAGTNNKGNNENNENKDKHPRDPKSETKVLEEVLDLYHNTCGSLPKVLKISPQRKSAINARINDHGIDGVKQMLTNVAESEFLQGNNSKNWAPDFDWLFKPQNFLKIIEGTYKNKNNGRKSEITESGIDSKDKYLEAAKRPVY